MVASKRMQELFHRCFEQGRLHAWDRPTMTEWRSMLDDATSMLLDCHNPDCFSSFIRNSSCPFCDTEADPSKSVLLFALVYSSDPVLEHKLMKTGYGQALNLGETISLKRVPAGTALFHESSEVCQVRLDDKGLAVKVLPGNSIRLVLDGKEQEITRGILLDYDKKQGRNYFLHLTPAQQLDEHPTHPVWAFRW